MVLYTIVDVEQVMKDQGTESAPTVELTLGHAVMQVQPINAKQAKVVRFMSPLAQDYLDPRVAPGAIIDWGFQLDQT